MTVVVTGATGFLGSAVVRRLVKDGTRVIALKRTTSDARRLAGFMDRIVAWDVDVRDVADVFREHRVEHIVHTATMYGDGTAPSRLLDTNVRFPLRLMELAAEHDVRGFINTDTYFSRFADYPYQRDYCLTKRHARDWLDYHREAFIGVNVVMHDLYGPDGNPNRVLARMLRSMLCESGPIPVSPGEQRRNFIHVEDAAAAYVLLMERIDRFAGRLTDVDVVAGESLPLKQAVQTMAQLTGTESRLRFGALPYRENEIMDPGGDPAILSGLGWAPEYDFERGILETIQYERGKANGGVCG